MKSSRLLVILVCVLLAATATTAAIRTSSAQPGGDWSHCADVSIQEESGTNLSNYQVAVGLHSMNFDFSRAKDDGSDVSFYDGGDELSHWIEEWDPVGEQAKIWVEVSSIPANGETTIHMYCNPSATGSFSDGPKTFLFFDDFEGGSGKWDPRDGNGSAGIATDPADPSNDVYHWWCPYGHGGCNAITSKMSLTSDVGIVLQAKGMISNVEADSVVEAHLINASDGSKGVWAEVSIDGPTRGNDRFGQIPHDSIAGWWCADNKGNFQENVWVDYKLVLTPTQVRCHWADANHPDPKSCSTGADYTGRTFKARYLPNVSVDARSGSFDLYLDNVFAREYVSPPPAVTVTPPAPLPDLRFLESTPVVKVGLADSDSTVANRDGLAYGVGYEGDKIKVEYYVKNAGGASPASKTKIWLSTDTTIDAADDDDDDKVLGTLDTDPFDAGEARAYQPEVMLRDGLELELGASYYVLVELDALDDITESDEANNTQDAQIRTPTDVIENVPLITQQPHQNACWAASSMMVLEFYGIYADDLSLLEIAHEIPHEAAFCTGIWGFDMLPFIGGWQYALERLGELDVDPQYLAGDYFTDIIQQVNLGQPIILNFRWWPSEKGHTMVVVGYLDRGIKGQGDDEDVVFLADPWANPPIRTAATWDWVSDKIYGHSAPALETRRLTEKETISVHHTTDNHSGWLVFEASASASEGNWLMEVHRWVGGLIYPWTKVGWDSVGGPGTARVVVALDSEPDADDDGDCVGDPPTPPATACSGSGGIDEDPIDCEDDDADGLTDEDPPTNYQLRVHGPPKPMTWDTSIIYCPDDSDSDGIPDCIDGDPADADADDDGLSDGSIPGSEDLNNNGIVDPGETDPRNWDTDGDGLSDGLERGLNTPETPDTDTSSPHWQPDADPSARTDPLNPDSDGDGVSDGVEDANHNGMVDAGEQDPNNPDTDGDGVADDSDNCPLAANPDQADLDGDGTGDVCDPQNLVLIDIKPGSYPNSINLRSKGVIPVAILTSEDFDAATVDADTVRFGPAEAEKVHKRAHVEDADGDGDLDLVLHFRTGDTGIAPGDTEACLTGQTYDGVPIQGCDLVRTVP